MEKGFKFQKVGFVVYLLVMIIVAIYSVCFMTNYYDLYGYLTKANAGIKDFYTHLQAFNRIFFWFALAGVISIIFMFALELRKKVCDKIALGIMSAFGALNIGTAVYGFISFSKLMSEYKTVDFTKRYLENPKVLEGDVYVLKFATFYIGFAVFAVLILVAIGFIATLWINHIIYKRNEVVAHEEA